jgi:NAD-dependent dihydropyrimidine dehydrogenase PreA subunit
MYSKKIVLRYTADVADKPIVCCLAKDYGLTFNILKARILPRREGVMVLELVGTRENFDRGIRYLKESGLKVESLSKSVVQNTDRCVHCGSCLAFCSAGALYLDKETMKVLFDPEKCSGCEICVSACPVRAMEVNLL